MTTNQTPAERLIARERAGRPDYPVSIYPFRTFTDMFADHDAFITERMDAEDEFDADMADEYREDADLAAQREGVK